MGSAEVSCLSSVRMAVSTCQIYVVYMTNIDHFIGHIYGQRNGAAHIVLHDAVAYTQAADVGR